jgi:hypothetical protein
MLTAPWAMVAVWEIGVAADVELLEDEAESESGAPNAANETDDDVELLVDELITAALTAAWALVVAALGTGVCVEVECATVANVPPAFFVSITECNREVMLLPCRYINVVVNVKVKTFFSASRSNDSSLIAADASSTTGAFPKAATVVPFVPLPLAVTAKY